MKSKLVDILHVWTEDDLYLQGVHYFPEEKDLCVLFVHGMSGNVMENYFAQVLGETLAANGIGMVFSHNRGYNHINDILTKEEDKNGSRKTVRIGARYERFEDCLKDLSVWLNKCRELGYKKIIILGHSLGCNKTLYFYHQQKDEDVIGIVLASPPDLVGLAKMPKYQPNYSELLEEARKNVAEGNPRKMLSTVMWDWYEFSSQTFLDLFEEGGPADNLPVLKNPEVFSELAQIDVPILGLMGEYDDIAIRTLEEDLNLIASKASSCPSFTKKFIKGANHMYDQQEEVFAETVLEWIKKNHKRG